MFRMTDVTRILDQINRGDESAAEQLLPLVDIELRKLASARMAGERPGQTLDPTSLVHEAYIRLVDVAGGLDSSWTSSKAFRPRPTATISTFRPGSGLFVAGGN